MAGAPPGTTVPSAVATGATSADSPFLSAQSPLAHVGLLLLLVLVSAPEGGPDGETVVNPYRSALYGLSDLNFGGDEEGEAGWGSREAGAARRQAGPSF